MRSTIKIDVDEEIQDRADKIMRDMGYEGFKGYSFEPQSALE